MRRRQWRKIGQNLRKCRYGSWQVRNKKEVIEEARTKGAKVHFASLMDLCHFKNSDLESQYLKYKGRVVLRGDTVKDDSGSYEVFTEQGSSASQMTAAKSHGRHLQIARVAQDKQLTQYQLAPRSKWKMHRRYWKIQSRIVQTFGFVDHDTNGQNHGPVWKTQSFLLNGIYMVILWQD